MKNRTVFPLMALLFMCAVFAFPEYVLCSPIRVVREDAGLITYYLHKNDLRTASSDLLVVLQGSDCNSVMHMKAIDRLRDVYGEADLLTVEKYGITAALPYRDRSERNDCPEGYLEHDTPELRVSDADLVIRTLREAYAYSRVILIGGSEGAVVAGMLSARAEYVAAAVLFGCGGRYFRDDVIHSMKYQYRSKKELERNVEGFTRFAEQIVSAEPFPVSMSDHGYSWWRSMLSLDQESVLASVRCPVLILQGSNDRSASTKKAAEMYVSLRKRGKTNIEYRVYDRYDHSLNLSLQDDSSERVVHDIRRWLREKLNRGL